MPPSYNYLFFSLISTMASESHTGRLRDGSKFMGTLAIDRDAGIFRKKKGRRLFSEEIIGGRGLKLLSEGFLTNFSQNPVNFD